MQYTAPSQEVSLHSPLPYFDPLSVEVHPQEQRLAFEFVDNGTYAWLAPLRSSSRNQGDTYVAAEFLGHEAVLVNRDVLHVLSPVEKRLLWSKPLDGGGDGGPVWRHASRDPMQPMSTPSSDHEQESALLQSASHTGRLAVVQPDYLCVYGRRSITVLDTRTGVELWSRDGLPHYAKIVGNRDAVFVVPQERDKVQAYRASDGKPLKIDGLSAMLSDALLMRGGSMLLLEQGPTLRFLGWNRAKTILRLHEPLAKQDLWKSEFPPASLVSLLDDDEVLVVPPDGKVERIDVATGRRLALAPLPAADLKVRRNESFAAHGRRSHLFTDQRAGQYGLSSLR